MKCVLVVGGRGFMGRRVMRLMTQSLPDAEVLSGGRSDSNDRVLEVRSPEGSYGALRDVDVLVNAVGPFTYDPRPLIRACIDNGVHYVDLAESNAFIAASSVDTMQTAVVSGCSSVPGLIQVLARSWRSRDDVTSVRAQLSIGTNNPSSATLLFSMLDPVGRPALRGRWFDHTWRHSHEGLSDRRYGVYPGGVDQVDLGGRAVPLKFGFGLDRSVYTTSLSLAAPLLAATPRVLLRAAATVGSALSPLARGFGTRIGILAVDALGANDEVLESIEVRAHDNGLDVPAWPSVWAAEALIGGTGKSGSLSLADLVTPESAVERLRQAGYEVLGQGGLF